LASPHEKAGESSPPSKGVDSHSSPAGHLFHFVLLCPLSADFLRLVLEVRMGIEDNGPENAYQGPAEPGSEEEIYPDVSEDTDSGEDAGASEDAQTAARNKGLDEMEIPDNPPVDEAEEPSPGNS
jgi:hypothetical protein